MKPATPLFTLMLLVGSPKMVKAQTIVPAEEIKAMLSGNTILGTWGSERYRQYFREDGATIYAPEKSRSSRGKWRVNAENNSYESWWERSGWAAYRVVREDGNLYWTNFNIEYKEPFEVLPGQQLAWKKED